MAADSNLLPLENLAYWGRTNPAEEDITCLPTNWDARVTEEGRMFFLNHSTRKTQWAHPTSNIKYRVPRHLPYGWQMFRDNNDVLLYVDYLEGLSSRTDPRLLNSVAYDFPEKFDIRPFAPFKRRFKPYVRAEEILNQVELTDNMAIVTGASSGLGFETARCLAANGCHVIMACRDSRKANEALRKIQGRHPSSRVEVMELDLASLRSVKHFAEAFLARGLPLNILVCNAAVIEWEYCVSEDGLERTFATNHLGHFFLVELLLNQLMSSAPSRVVVVSSESHWYPSARSYELDISSLQHSSRKSFSPLLAYGASKLCNILFAMEVHRRYSGRGVSCNAVHPGNLVSTQLMRNAGCLYKTVGIMASLLTSSVEQAASTVVFCAAHPLMDKVSGLYWYRCKVAEPSHEAQRASSAAALWEFSEQLLSSKTAHL